MKNHNPAGRRLHFASAGQRLFAIFVLAVFACLVWLAWTGRYDTEVNRLAAWFGGHYHALVD